ncbi:MAG: flagellar motor switch phosphatase FliY [Clostridiales bacterium]|jgi:flagellar motor switch protein FliN/FliY|nr:flagellar motor switch phosphatase FliY [Clostridiales bacterium]
MNLSQDEINALLDENNLAHNSEEKDSGLLNESVAETSVSNNVNPEYLLTDYEKDTLGEVGNMCMGAVATTMYTLLDRRVSITTPRVSIHTTREVLLDYSIPFVLVEVQYTSGIQGKNLLLLKEPDAALITDLLMGGEGKIEEPVVLNEMHMSAISEIMNQMIGAAATALAKLLHIQVNISPPKSDRVEVHADLTETLDYSQVVVKISFDMVIEGLLESQLIQLIPYDFARNLANKLMDAYSEEENVEENISNQSNLPDIPEEIQSGLGIQSEEQSIPAETVAQITDTMAAQPQSQHSLPIDSSYVQAEKSPGNLVDVHPIQFQSFDENKPANPINKSLDMVYDIPLQVSVELGKTQKEISEILEFGMGTVIVLEKMAGDPVEVLANGKLIARGEVVVIDENYGVRITELFNK